MRIWVPVGGTIAVPGCLSRHTPSPPSADPQATLNTPSQAGGEQAEWPLSWGVRSGL